MECIRVVGKLFTYRNKPITLRGFGIGTWLNLEHFMIGLPTPDEMIKSAYDEVYGANGREEFFSKYREEFFKEEDFRLLKECGVNFIRVPFNYRLFMEDNSDTYLEEGFLCFDRLFSLCSKYEIFALIDLHTTPGSQNPDWHSDNSFGVPLFWKYQVFRRQMTNLWRTIAKRYEKEPYLMGYDLINEPAFASWPIINEFYEETIKAIREVDNNHIIVLEGDQFSMDFSGLKHFEEEQLALSFHYYPTVWHPDLLEATLDRNVRREKIAKGLDTLVNIREVFHCPVFCGEYGYGADCGNRTFTMELLNDTMELMEERKVDWLLWCYKDAHFMSMVSPKESSKWMKLVRNISKEWSQDIEKEQAEQVLELIQHTFYTTMTKEDRYLLQFSLRACLYVLQKKYILIPNLESIEKEEMLQMAMDFSFENCEIDQEFMDLIKKYVKQSKEKGDINLPDKILDNEGIEDKNLKELPIWKEELSLEERLDYLIHELTLEEKIQCLTVKSPEVTRLGLKPFSIGGEAAHGVEARHDQVFNKGIPVPTTTFTQPIGMSATWDTKLMKQVGGVVGKEARIIYAREGEIGLSRWGPTVDMERDPRWGRTEEGYGEDPFLTGKMSSNYIRGLQGDDDFYIQCAATLKHFYANNEEKDRGHSSASLDERNKKEYYLEPFKRAVIEGGAESIMTSYNEINGIPAILNKEVKELAKETWGLKGHVVCDMYDLMQTVTDHNYCETHAESISYALKAGIDVFNDPEELVIQAAKEALEKGFITNEDIDKAIRRTFSTKLRLGLYDSGNLCPYSQVEENRLTCKEHKDICLEVAMKAVVLLKNDNHLLPLNIEQGESIAVIGPLANEWNMDWYSGIPPYKITPYEGIRREYCQANITLSDGNDRIKIKVGEQYLVVDEKGRCHLSDYSHGEIFEHTDWGDNKHTFRACSNHKFLSANPETGRIEANKEEVFSWLVQESFSLIEEKEDCENTKEENKSTKEKQQDYHFRISAWNKQELYINDEKELVYKLLGSNINSQITQTVFSLEIITEGITKAVDLAKHSDKVIAVIGCHPIISSKEDMDRNDLLLPPIQRELLKRIKEVNENIICVLITNYPYTIDWEKENLPAILTTASGSQQLGTAIAKAIAGEYSPAGRLNMTWYEASTKLPIMRNYDIIHAKRTYQYFNGKVLYPFGYGLTYTRFDYQDLIAWDEENQLHIEFTLKNIGQYESDEVVELYISQLESRTVRPIKQLKGFERVHLRREEETRLSFLVAYEELEYYDVVTSQMVLEDSNYLIQVGASSEDIRLDSVIHVNGTKIRPRDMTVPILCDHYDYYENMILHIGHDGKNCILPDPFRQKKDAPWKGKAIYKDVNFSFLPSKLIIDLKAEEESLIKIWCDKNLLTEFSLKKMADYEKIELEICTSESIVGVTKTLEIEAIGRIRLIEFQFQ
ncbi:glycoside hydrolase family 3 C-terminal domain-containing protein [Anaeromicropila herbilytica]|uniref:Fibronectin type III-like domain-containing protein n=1 Tax=Anaeromicropila herbilytica TaxID=2785025 RepID=A0A7R7EKN8_9FIRM|nr:glycoside hydrolase family 3 C-terminal domain-containing protein [Anaeromicropila herbilytica]BCN30880.1 hypothetical protein bsdtb5_21750 [Anaeromicropila herbilytica]